MNLFIFSLLLILNLLEVTKCTTQSFQIIIKPTLYSVADGTFTHDRYGSIPYGIHLYCKSVRKNKHFGNKNSFDVLESNIFNHLPTFNLPANCRKNGLVYFYVSEVTNADESTSNGNGDNRRRSPPCEHSSDFEFSHGNDYKNWIKGRFNIPNHPQIPKIVLNYYIRTDNAEHGVYITNYVEGEENSSSSSSSSEHFTSSSPDPVQSSPSNFVHFAASSEQPSPSEDSND